MKRIFPRSVLVAAAAVFVLSVLGNVAVPYASAQAVESPDSAMEQQTKEWLYYRGMWACLHGGFNDANLSRSDIEKGTWDPQNDKKGFGYFAPDMDEGDDGTVDCDDGSIFARAPGVFGFEDQVDLFCAIDAKLDKDMIDPVGGDCKTARDYKVERYKSGVVSKAFTEVLTDKMAGKRPRFELRDNPNYNAMYYWIGKRSVEVFCGGGTSLEDGITDLNNDDKAVMVKIVDTSSGAVTESQTYNLDGRIDSDLIDDVYYRNDGDDEKAVEKRCSELATLTRDHAIHFSQYIISQLNLALANYFKDKFEPSDELRDSLCTKPPADGDEIDSPEERVYKACIDNIVTRFDNIVDQCAASAELKTPMEYETRRDTLRKCITKNLPPEYRADIDKIPDPDIEERVGEASVGTTSCAIEGVGWIVCPVLNFMGMMNDAAFGFISDFLTIEPKLLTDDDTKAAWNNFRDIANVAFVLAFLVIVYSQMVGGGLTNYGIKRLLPRLIVAAVLVNISYYLCQIAVDISNIAGSSVYSFFKDLPTSSEGTAGFGDGLSWGKVTGYALAAAGAVIVAIVALLSISTAALLAFGLMILILIGRKAALILLVVISPLAFVAYLLPNTEQWFKKWWKMFSTLLMVFPVVGVIFGASTLAARIVNNSAGDPTDSTILLQITALGIMAVPLFAVPLVLKGALSATGTIGAKIAGLQDRANKGAMNKAKSGRLGEAKTAFDARKRQRKVERRLGNGTIASWGNDARRSGTRRGKVASVVGSLGSRVDQSGAGRYLGGDRGAAAAVSEQQKLNNEAVERSMSVLQNNKASDVIGKAQAQLKAAHDKGDEIAARAATRVLAQGTGARGVDKLHETLSEIESASPTGSLNSKIADDVKHEVNSASLKGKNRSLDKWSRDEGGTAGGTDLHAYDTDTSTTRGLNESELAGHSLTQLRRFGSNGVIEVTNADRVLKAHAAGTIHLDAEKLQLFNDVVSSTPIPPP